MEVGGQRGVATRSMRMPEVAAVADAMVPPGEPLGSRFQSGDVDVDETAGEESGVGFPALGCGDVGRTDEGLGMDHVAARSIQVLGTRRRRPPS
jgi:hypothetical protein